MGRRCDGEEVDAEEVDGEEVDGEEGTVTWSRERNGNKVALITIDSGREIRHNDPGKRYGSSRDKSLHFLTLTLSDSGRYFCNDEAVELTVIPLGTIRVDAPERTSVTLDCPHDDGGSHDPTWSRDSVEIHRQKGFDVPPVDRTLTLTDVELRDSGLYYCGRKAVFLQVIEVASKDQQQSLIRMVFYVLLLLILIISIIVYFSRKRRFRKQGLSQLTDNT
ncbi:hypothetical protein JOQ06_015343 [Pogonophryne albipinna]|uniref:Ig-like domain-containing protein n=1 Tax=Pogonophryne albipinna TaxID=1090488 RepID=A0AAD6A9N7_9TELE|nr:hypothetical protein JOQ06_015343 [Pogonophryne albipinna]